MFVWSKRLVFTLLAVFILLLGAFLLGGAEPGTSALKVHTTRWITLNFAGLVLWVFVWMVDQARVRGKNVWLWLGPFLIAPLPTLLAFILFLQRRIK